MHRFRISLFVLCIAAGCLLQAGCSRKNDVSGTWKGTITLPSTGKSLSELEFSLTQKGKDLFGTLLFTKQGGKLPLTGVVVDRKVTLKSPMKNGLALSFTGTMESRRKIAGDALLDYDAPGLEKRQDKTVMELTR